MTSSESQQSAFSPALSHVLEDVRREIAWRFGDTEASRLPANLSEMVSEIATRLGFGLSSFERDEIISVLESEWSPFGVLQPLIEDPTVTDIIISAFNRISIQRGRSNFRTQISFANQRAYEGLMERLLQKAGAVCSTKQPITDGMIGPYIRLHVVHQSLCDGGPYVTLRINRFSSVGISDLIKNGLAPKPILEYLCAAVAGARTVLVVGEVGTGKTTLVRALASTIPAEEAVLVIEDTPEIRLEHPHVRYIATRGENLEGEGRISPAQCIRAGMRMAMNRIIFGEIRDSEAAEAFVDVCASGHAGLSTIHARTAAEAIIRLELFLGRAQRGAEKFILTQQVATSVHVIVVLDVCKPTRKRRIFEVREIGPVADGIMRQREIFTYRPTEGSPEWNVTHRISAFRSSLESAPFALNLADLPPTLELPLEVTYRETAQGRLNAC